MRSCSKGSYYAAWITRAAAHASASATVAVTTTITATATNINARRRIQSYSCSHFTNTVSTRDRVVAYPQSPRRSVPQHIVRPPYAASAAASSSSQQLNADAMETQFLQQQLGIVELHNKASIQRLRTAARLARHTLEAACYAATAAASSIKTTDDLDRLVHDTLIAHNAYPSPLLYPGNDDEYSVFPKSVCTSINEIICHGIPDLRPIRLGDVLSMDVSCYVFFADARIGVHGDTCATIIVGDRNHELSENDASNHEKNTNAKNATVDWRGVPYRTSFDSDQDEAHFIEARKLVATTHEALRAGIAACKPGGCLSDIGAAIQDVSDHAGYSSVRKYRGHGISSVFHCPPFVKHYRNHDTLELRPGMIFTIEPMLTQGRADCYEWDDHWTVATLDGSLAAQFEHTVLITEDGVEILTVATDHK